MPYIAAGIGFGKNTETGTPISVYDLGVSAGVSHSFDWEWGNVGYSVLPSILLNGGTNEYFSFLNITKYIGHSNKFVDYVKKGAGARKRRGAGSGSGSTPVTTTGGEQFNLTNVQLNVESSVDINALSIRPTISLYLPVGSASGNGAAWFWELAVGYRF